MKFSNLSKLAGASVLAASLSMAALTQPASAQSTTGSDSSNTTTTQTTPSSDSSNTTTRTSQGVDSANYNRDNGFDWGWLGLLGLAGLAGLAGRKQEEPSRYREPDEVSSSSYRR